MTTMLDFYQQHGIAPVKQDIGDLQAHFQRRAFLYRQLGLWPQSIAGKRVLEVGPGTGENARYTASLNPKTYVLVEPNDTAREALEKARPSEEVEIIGCSLEAYQGEEAFDVVLCEGLLGLAGRDPRELLTALGEKVTIGGVLVITCIDAISQCAEVLRRALAQRYINSDMTLAEKVQVLTPVFAPHLATLKGMSRSVEDWIVDNLLNPASIGPTFSIPDALTHVEGRFEVLGCSPRFLLDWRWYKEAQPGNAWAIESYWRKCHNLFDYRFIRPERTEKQNRVLMEDCARLRALVAEGEEQGWVSKELAQKVESDIGWFGRGQQYLSLVRVA